MHNSARDSHSRSEGVRLCISSLSEVEWAEHLAGVEFYSFFSTPGFFRVWIAHFAPDADITAVRIEHSDAGTLLIPFVDRTVSRSLRLHALSGAPEWGYGISGSYRGALCETSARALARHLTAARIESCHLVSDPLLPVDLSALCSFGMRGEALETDVLRLSGSYDVWFNDTLDKRVRRQIARCAGNGMVTQRAGVEALEDFYPVYEAAVAERGGRGRIYPKAFLRDLLNCDGPGSARLYLTRSGGDCIAGGILLCGKGVAVAWIGAVRREFRQLNANIHRHATVIRNLYDEGFSYYNLGASPGLPGVAQYKRKLGALPVSYSIYTWRSPVSSALRGLRRIFHP